MAIGLMPWHQRGFQVLLADRFTVGFARHRLMLTAVEKGGAGPVSRRSKMAAHSRAVLWEGRHSTRRARVARVCIFAAA